MTTQAKHNGMKQTGRASACNIPGGFACPMNVTPWHVLALPYGGDAPSGLSD